MIYELGEACMKSVDGHILSQSMFIGSPYNTPNGKSIGLSLRVGPTRHTQPLYLCQHGLKSLPGPE